MTNHLSLSFPYAYSGVRPRAMLKSENTHFFVAENLGFTPSGEGEHLYLFIESNGDNTQWVADKIAEHLGVKPVDVGFCGLKDRNAITRQWFSVYDPKREAEPKLVGLSSPERQILSQTRSHAKLRRGDHAGNHFLIRLGLEEPLSDAYKAELTERLAIIALQGVPNYFGLQRFGRMGSNLQAFDQWLIKQAQTPSPPGGPKNKRAKRSNPTGLVLSAARSLLFNRLLAKRVEQDCWAEVIAGDVCADQLPTGPLWGRGRSATAEVALTLEQEALAPLKAWADALEHLGLQQERRVLVNVPQDFNWQWEGQMLVLSFGLLPGAYATVVLRELCDCYEPLRLR